MEKCTTEVYSRVTGYFQPVAQWNEGKSEEFKDRQRYKGVCDERDKVSMETV